MPTTRVSPKHQITIPREVFNAANLEVGDLLEAAYERGRVVLIPKRLVSKEPAVELSAIERQALKRAEKKMKVMNEDLLNSRGLTRKEIAAAVKAGLILEDQAYFWTEEWQKDERASERDVQAGRVSGPYSTAEELLAGLHELKQQS